MRVWPNRTSSVGSILMCGLLLVPTTVLFLATWWRSLAWDTIVEVPTFLYTGLLMDRFGMAPVRDFFTYQMPGAHVAYRWFFHFFGSSMYGMRQADTAVLAVVLPLLALLLAPFGRRVAWAGTVIFGLLHLRYGGLCYLQLNYLAIVPIALMVLSATAWFGRTPRLRWFFTGLFCGALMTLRPLLPIGGVVVFAYLVLDRDTSVSFALRDWLRRARRIALYCGLGFSVPVLWTIGYYAYYGALGEFIGIVVDFFPLRADIGGGREIIERGGRLSYTLFMALTRIPWDDFQLAMGAVGGAALFLFVPGLGKRERVYGFLLMGVTLAYWVYPCFSARFSDHDYYPFRFFACGWLALCFRALPSGTPVRAKAFSAALAAYAVVSLFYVKVDTLGKPVEALPSSYDPAFRTQRISGWLARRIQPGDTVQPIEWGYCGITHAVLENRAKIATRIVWGDDLFHHVSNPYVQGLRTEFVEGLAAARPRFVIRSKVDWDFITGRDCSDIFPELDSLLEREYFVAVDARDFCIWESNDSPTALQDRAAAERDETHGGAGP